VIEFDQVNELIHLIKDQVKFSLNYLN
jgi:hypothetical protein